MSMSLPQDVLMVAPEYSVETHLEQAASRNGWPLIQGQPIPQILRQVVMHNPRVVVVQIGQMLEQAMNLIGALRQLRPGTRVIAASVTHHELIEQATRCAGATCYLPDAADTPLLEETVASLEKTTSRVDANERRDLAAASQESRMRAGGRAVDRPFPHRNVVGYLIAAFLLSVFGLSFVDGGKAQAAPIILKDKQGSASFNLDNTGVPVGTPIGLYDMQRPQYELGVDPTLSPKLHDVTQQWFWFRVGGAGPEFSINTLTLVSAIASNKNPSVDSDNDRLRLTYTYNGAGGRRFELRVVYDFIGSDYAGHTSALTRNFTITNTGTANLDMHFFDYSDLTLTYADNLAYEGAVFPDMGSFISADRRTVRQYDFDGGYNPATDNYDFDNRLNSDSQTTAFTSPAHVSYGVNSSIRTLLQDGSATTLNDVLVGDGGTPGDLNFAFQYDFSLAPGQGYIGGANLLITPEPASLMLMGASSVLLMGRPRRRRPFDRPPKIDRPPNPSRPRGRPHEPQRLTG